MRRARCGACCESCSWSCAWTGTPDTDHRHQATDRREVGALSGRGTRKLLCGSVLSCFGVYLPRDVPSTDLVLARLDDDVPTAMTACSTSSSSSAWWMEDLWHRDRHALLSLLDARC